MLVAVLAAAAGTSASTPHAQVPGAGDPRVLSLQPVPDLTGTMWEKLTASGAPEAYTSASPGMTSLAHGWSTGAVAALSGYVPGLRPTSPRRIEGQRERLRRGRVPGGSGSPHIRLGLALTASA